MHCSMMSENDRIMNMIDYNNPLYKPLADGDDFSIVDDDLEGEDFNPNESHQIGIISFRLGITKLSMNYLWFLTSFWKFMI